MNTQKTPKFATFKSGESLEVYQVTFHAGMKMQLHYSTKGAMVIVKEGFAKLKIDEIKHILLEGSSVIIPARQNHSLSIKAKFKALIILSQDSNIEFLQ